MSEYPAGPFQADCAKVHAILQALITGINIRRRQREQAFHYSLKESAQDLPRKHGRLT